MGTPVWKGQLVYGGRSVAVRILTGARGENPSFNQLHATDLSRVKQVLYCQGEDKPIARTELVKGYEYEKGKFATLTEEEIESLAPAAGDSIELRFVPLEQMDPTQFESSYYVAPAQDELPYAALFGALRRTSLAGIALMRLYSRERPMIFRAGKLGIVAHTLFFSHELRSLDEFRTDEQAASESEITAAMRALKRAAGDFGYQDYPDLQQQRVERLIASKVAAAGSTLPGLGAGEKPSRSRRTAARG